MSCNVKRILDEKHDLIQHQWILVCALFSQIPVASIRLKSTYLVLISAKMECVIYDIVDLMVIFVSEILNELKSNALYIYL